MPYSCTTINCTLWKGNSSPKEKELLCQFIFTGKLEQNMLLSNVEQTNTDIIIKSVGLWLKRKKTPLKHNNFLSKTYKSRIKK